MQKAKTLKTFSVRLWWSVAAKVGYIYAKLDFFSYFLLKINVDLQGSSHCVKYRNFTQFPGVEVLRKGTAIRLKLCGNCAFPQNLHTRKLGEIGVFYAVSVISLSKEIVPQRPSFTGAITENITVFLENA